MGTAHPTVGLLEQIKPKIGKKIYTSENGVGLSSFAIKTWLE
jgi:hypothetical protein